MPLPDILSDSSKPICRGVVPTMLFAHRIKQVYLAQFLQIAAGNHVRYLDLTPISTVPHPEPECRADQRGRHSLMKPELFSLAADSLPYAADLPVSLNQRGGLLLVRAQANPNPWKSIILWVPGALADFHQFLIVGMRVAAEPFFDAAERGAQDPLSRQAEGL